MMSCALTVAVFRLVQLACGVPVPYSTEEWKGKKVVLFSVPGAFTVCRKPLAIHDPTGSSLPSPFFPCSSPPATSTISHPI